MRRRTGRDDAEHVPFVDQLLGDLLEQIADATGVAEVQVQVVDEDQEDAAGGVVGRPRRRQEDAFLHGRRRRRGDVVAAPAVGQRERDELLLNAVLEDLEVFFLQVGDELAVVVADDDVRRDEFDARGEIGLALILRLDRDAERRQRAVQSTPRLPPGYCLHAADYKPR